MRSTLVLAAAIVSLVCFSSVRAAVIYDNFGPADTYTTTGGSNISAFINIAAPFTPAADATATTLVVAMSNGSASDANVTLTLANDNNGRPGTAITSGLLTVSVGEPHIYLVTLTLASPLTAGTPYWIKASPTSGSPGGTATWMPNATGATGIASTLPTGFWFLNANGVTPALRVEDDALPTGACCAGSTCVVTGVTFCNANHTHFLGIGTVCNPVGNTAAPCCKADFNQSGDLSVQDIFDFLDAWFSGNGQADINGDGLSVQDIFDFLTAWFAGC